MELPGIDIVSTRSVSIILQYQPENLFNDHFFQFNPYLNKRCISAAIFCVNSWASMPWHEVEIAENFKKNIGNLPCEEARS